MDIATAKLAMEKPVAVEPETQQPMQVLQVELAGTESAKFAATLVVKFCGTLCKTIATVHLDAHALLVRFGRQ